MLDQTVLNHINKKAVELEEKINADVIYYNGPMHHIFLKDFRNFIEMVAGDEKRDTIAIFLKTNGGLVEPVEKMVEILRHHYKFLHFFVPDLAMSAGTILCMSGDKIFMDYSSSLGPIDPQVLVRGQSGDHYVPALGYLEQVERLVRKSNSGEISPAEYAILQQQDLAVLNSYEQARDLSIELLKKWLVQYKFRDWTHHRSDPKKVGSVVSDEEKEQRAREIAARLSDHAYWHSHGRMIGANTLRMVLKLEIDDYTDDEDLRSLIRVYNDVLTDYIERQGYSFYLHNRQTTAQA